jgi:hypothetical protein
MQNESPAAEAAMEDKECRMKLEIGNSGEGIPVLR